MDCLLDSLIGFYTIFIAVLDQTNMKKGNVQVCYDLI